MMTHTIDEYIANLYDRLWECLVIVKLQPGDCILVCLDAFQGQWRKLKNRWGGDLGYQPM